MNIENTEYIKPNAKISTLQFGEILRSKYKALVECYTLYKHIIKEIKEHNLPIEITLKVNDNGFANDYIDRVKGLRDSDITDEQRYFENIKTLGLLNHLYKHTTAILNR